MIESLFSMNKATSGFLILVFKLVKSWSYVFKLDLLCCYVIFPNFRSFFLLFHRQWLKILWLLKITERHMLLLFNLLNFLLLSFNLFSWISFHLNYRLSRQKSKSLILKFAKARKDFAFVIRSANWNISFSVTDYSGVIFLHLFI